MQCIYWMCDFNTQTKHTDQFMHAYKNIEAKEHVWPIKTSPKYDFEPLKWVY